MRINTVSSAIAQTRRTINDTLYLAKFDGDGWLWRQKDSAFSSRPEGLLSNSSSDGLLEKQ
jgi:hypothetical protein